MNQRENLSHTTSWQRNSKDLRSRTRGMSQTSTGQWNIRSPKHHQYLRNLGFHFQEILRRETRIIRQWMIMEDVRLQFSSAEIKCIKQLWTTVEMSHNQVKILKNQSIITGANWISTSDVSKIKSSWLKIWKLPSKDKKQK